MGFVKRTNKKFDYTPRYYKGEGNPFKIEHTFDQYRKTDTGKKGLKAKVNLAMEDLKVPQSKESTRIIVIVVAILIFIFLYIIDFDLSIFRTK
jgi:hypothetical protein